MAKPKLCRNSAEVTTSNGEITFIAARGAENLNGWTYDVKSLQAQTATGDFITLTNQAQEVAIPLMSDHSNSVADKIGTIDSAQIVEVDGVDQVEMHATFFSNDQAQTIRQRILDGELTDVSISTDWGTSNDDTLENAHIIEVSIVYAGAEPKAKILAKNSIDNEPEPEEEPDTPAEPTEPTEPEPEKPTEPEPQPTNQSEEDIEMALQPTNAPTDEGAKTATKEAVLNEIVALAKNNQIKGMNRAQVREAVENALTLKDSDGSTYVVPDAVFTEILAVTRPTDILNTFQTVPVKRFTIMGEVPSEADLARAGRWTKGEQKQIQNSDLKAQKLATQFLYKLQELSYEDLQEDFGDVLLAYVHAELPQKVAEEEERDFIVGDGRESNDDRHISSIVSLDAAAADSSNVHVANYDGSSDGSALAAVIKGTAKLAESGVTHATMNRATLASFRAAGLDSAAGLPFSVETVAGALGVDTIFVREYVANDVVYVWTENKVLRLTGSSNGETIEQYDIDYNNRKIEFIRPVGGAAVGLYSAVKITLPSAVSA